MKRILTCSGTLSSLILLAGGASADPTVQGLTLGVERVFGFTTTTATDEGDTFTSTTSATGFSLGNTGTSAEQALFSVPRVNVDYVLPMGLSFGGALGVASVGVRTETDPGPITVTTEQTLTGFLFAPRVGYMVGLSDEFGIWPRGGFSYVYAAASDDDEDEDDNSDISTGYGALTLEVPLLFAPTRSFGFVATPALDIGVTGSREVAGDEYDGDLSVTEFGITLGLFVVL